MTIRRRLEAAIFLFDMDGTLIDATATIEHIWTLWASRHGVDVAELLAASRGQRIVDTVREFAPTGVDEESEVQWLAQAGQSTTMGLIAIPGAIDAGPSLHRPSLILQRDGCRQPGCRCRAY
jgi:beta-phosphoglucomutase-like phosphatase (HAD superfamily)